MTNNEFKNKLLKKIDGFINTEMAANTYSKNNSIENELWYSTAKYDNYNTEASCIKNHIKKIVDDYFNENAIETDNSPYKEMWEELKKEIERTKSEYQKAEEDQCNAKLYHFATMSETRKKEDADILSVMDDIEKERGIEQ